MAITISHVQLSNGWSDAWTDLTGRYLNSEDHKYLYDKHNLRLCNLIYLTQQLKDSQLATSDQFEAGKLWHNVLAKVGNVEVTGIAPELRQKFLDLWDELDNLAHNAPTDQERQNATYVIDLLDTVNASFRPNH
jgi:hypothetical protein